MFVNTMPRYEILSEDAMANLDVAAPQALADVLQLRAALDSSREELEEVEGELRRVPPKPVGPSSADPNTPTPTASDALVQEIGDLLFAVVNLARKAGVDPGTALDRANRKFRDRFEAVERLAERRGVEVERAGLEALDRLWDEVKMAERT